MLIENLYAHVDDNGMSHGLLVGITDHLQEDNAVAKANRMFVTPQGTRKRRITTKGWKLLVEWDNGTSSWIPLKDIKDSNPLEVAEYAQSHDLLQEPAFA